MTETTPTDPDALRADIARTRADLGDTVEALAGKLDVKTRVRDAAVTAVSDAGDKLRSEVTAVRESVADGDVAAVVRRPLPVAAIALAAALVGVVIYLVRRQRV